MPLNVEYLNKVVFPTVEQVLTDRDVMLYALSIGLGSDPLDTRELSYVYEDGLTVFPTMPLIVGHPGVFSADPRCGITRAQVVHGAQRLSTYAQLPVGRKIVSTNRLIGLYDKGDRGALVVIERQTRTAEDGALIATSEMTLFCRADGNFGGKPGPLHQFQPVPERRPDKSLSAIVPLNAALLYRLNQDRNPLHADPEVARRAGFERPILHGLCTLGVAAVLIMRSYPDRILNSIENRFSSPVLPGDVVTVEIWTEDASVAFQARIATGSSVVLDRGRATFA